MKETLLEILRCPRCKNNPLYLEKNECGDLEITKGHVICNDCQSSYDIRNGIVNFLNGSSESVIRERKAMDEEEYITDKDGNRYRITDETIERFRNQFLSLPEGDGSHFFKRGGSFQSIAESASRFYSAFDELRLTGEESILEIGACFSYASFNFAKKGCRVVSMDISNYLKVANLFTERSYFDRVFSDMHDMPFRDNIFDVVFGSAVLHHSKRLREAFKEIYRVLKPGGRLVLLNESARGVFENVHPVFKEMDRKGFGDTSYTIPQWKRGAYGGGFRDVRICLLSLADDYITRHRNRAMEDTMRSFIPSGSRMSPRGKMKRKTSRGLTFKLRVAYFIKRHSKLEKIFLFLLIVPRILFRPKSWKLVCYK